MPSARPVRRRAWTAAVVLAVVAILVVVSHPWWLATAVGSFLSHTSERAVRFGSVRVGLSGALEPILHLKNVDIENAPWATSGRPFAKAGEAVMFVSWRSLTERRPVLSLLVLRDAEIDLERQADGLRNWRLREPEDRGPGRVKVLSLQAERSLLRIVHRGIELDMQTAATPTPTDEATSASGEPLPSRIELAGTLRGMAFSGSVATGAVLTFYETEQTFPLRGRADLGGVRVDVEGRAGDIFRAPQIDARVALAGKSLAAWRPFLGEHYRDARVFRVEGRVTADDRRYAIADARARIGATDLAGELGFVHGGERRSVHAKLHSDSADLADLLWLVGRDPRDARAGPAGGGTATPASTERFQLDRARELDADVEFTARRLRAPRLAFLQSLSFNATLSDGAVSVGDLDVGIADGHAVGRLRLDARPVPPTAKADLEWHGVRIEELVAGPGGRRRFTGAVRGRVGLEAAGDSAAALLADASGKFSASLAGGTVSSLLDATMGLEGGKIVRSLISGDEALALPCAALSLDVRKGRGRIASLVIASANTRTTGTGSIDLRDRTIDVVLTPTPKRPGLFELDRSIRLSGPLRQPQRRLVDRAAAGPSTACGG